MAVFMIHFLICNAFISGIIGILFLIKWIFKKCLSSRMQYNLWFLLLALLAVPFIPSHIFRHPQIFSWFDYLKYSLASDPCTTIIKAAITEPTNMIDWMNDFTLSVDSDASPVTGYLLFGIWVMGILWMFLLSIKSLFRLYRLEQSALPLQNREVQKLYHCCLDEMKIHKWSPVYSTAFLTTPVFTGVLRPRIFLPLHLISDHNMSDLRYIMLHELQHYIHKDSIAIVLMNLARIIYWFNPLVWYAMKAMCNDREIACDTSVLNMLAEESYRDYGNTLINYAEKVSHIHILFTASLSGNKKQLEKRILNIASYKKPSFTKKLRSIGSFTLTAILLLGFTPFISTDAVESSHYKWAPPVNGTSYIDLSTRFGEYDGSFVLYDLNHDSWSIYDVEHATLRVSPDSTYKIYDALFGLEEGIITSGDSFLPWNGERYPYDAWNADQTLQSAMASSVNWYFQSLDEKLGHARIAEYLQEIEYGNEELSDGLSSYWIGSTLKISPVEQVELLICLYHNSFGFNPENVNAVTEAIRLFSSDGITLYGKTGTGQVDGQNRNGWFIGYIETTDNTYFFATNIQAETDATGSNATEITMSILSDMNIWQSQTAAR